jgi:hypothetical protein
MVTTVRMSQLQYDPDTLLVTIHETGHEHLAHGHTVYGLGGIAVTGRMYNDLIIQPWRRVRIAVAGNADTPIHAADLSGRATPEQLSAVVAFFQQCPFPRFGAGGSIITEHPVDLAFMRLVIEGLKHRLIDVAKWCGFRSVAIIFEDNPRANSLIEEYFGDFGIEENGTPIPVDFHFMPKKSNEPGLEVADFVANAVGSQIRHHSVNGKPGFRKDFEAVFHNIDGRLVSFMEIASVERQAENPTV